MDQFSPLSQPAFPIEIVQGETFILPVTYQDDQGAVIDITGYDAKMQVRNTANSTDPAIVELSVDNGLIVITGTSGYLQCIIPAGTTDDLTPGLYVYDLFITSQNNVAERLLFGPVQITERVTK